MTSNNTKQAVRAIMADNPGMKYTEALRLHDKVKDLDLPGPKPHTPFGPGIDIATADLGEPVTLSDPLRGTIVSGATGSGKTVTVQGIITGAVRAGYDITVVEVVKPAVNYNGMGAEVIEPDGRDEQYLIDTLDHYLHADSQERDRLLIIEEFPALMSALTPEKRLRLGDLILDLSRLRHTGVIIVAQRMGGWIDYPDLVTLMNHFDNRILTGVPLSQERETVLGGPWGVPRVNPGDPVGTAILATGGEYTKFRPALPASS